MAEKINMGNRVRYELKGNKCAKRRNDIAPYVWDFKLRAETSAKLGKIIE